MWTFTVSQTDKLQHFSTSARQQFSTLFADSCREVGFRLQVSCRDRVVATALRDPPCGEPEHDSVRKDSLSARLQAALVAGGFSGRVGGLFVAGEEISQPTEDLFQLLRLDGAEAPGDQRTVRGEELADLDDALLG